jgi:hypothetical protein
LYERVENRLKLELGAADHFEHVSSGRLLLQGFPQLVQQPGVLDRYDGLAREVGHKRDLFVSKRPNLPAIDGNCAD